MKLVEFNCFSFLLILSSSQAAIVRINNRKSLLFQLLSASDNFTNSPPLNSLFCVAVEALCAFIWNSDSWWVDSVLPVVPVVNVEMWLSSYSYVWQCFEKRAGEKNGVFGILFLSCSGIRICMFGCYVRISDRRRYSADGQWKKNWLIKRCSGDSFQFASFFRVPKERWSRCRQSSLITGRQSKSNNNKNKGTRSKL